MNKKVIYALLSLAFLLGLATKLYLVPTIQPNSIPQLSNGEQSIDLFSPQDSRIRVLYFGFTRCPDVCPTSLAMLAAAFSQLPNDTIHYFRPIFITLDPERDSGTDAQKYAHYFYPDFEGLSGTVTAVEQLAQRYGVIHQKTQLQDSALQYTIDHSSYFYFVRPNGQLLEKVPHTLSPQPLIAAIQRIQQG